MKSVSSGAGSSKKIHIEKIVKIRENKRKNKGLVLVLTLWKTRQM